MSHARIFQFSVAWVSGLRNGRGEGGGEGRKAMCAKGQTRGQVLGKDFIFVVSQNIFELCPRPDMILIVYFLRRRVSCCDGSEALRFKMSLRHAFLPFSFPFYSSPVPVLWKSRILRLSCWDMVYENLVGKLDSELFSTACNFNIPLEEEDLYIRFINGM